MEAKNLISSIMALMLFLLCTNCTAPNAAPIPREKPDTTKNRSESIDSWALIYSQKSGISADILVKVEEFFRRNQALSWESGLEYCGYVIIDKSQRTSIKYNKGDNNGCITPLVYPPSVIVAGFHTQSSYKSGILSEIPSRQDFAATRKDGVDNFIGTPHGILWHIPPDATVAIKVCGPVTCLQSEPGAPKIAEIAESDLITEDQIQSLILDKK